MILLLLSIKKYIIQYMYNKYVSIVIVFRAQICYDCYDISMKIVPNAF